MTFKVINIVDSIEKINFGIWEAAISTASILKSKYKVDSELWFPETFPHNIETENIIKEKYCVTTFSYKTRNSNFIKLTVEQNKYDIAKTIIVTHGCWHSPTYLGYTFKRMGFKWIYVPHGMLEPWSMNQKFLRKWLYYNIFERNYTKHADYIRAVSEPEKINLALKGYRVFHIPNGTARINIVPNKNYEGKKRVLFLGRLHKKKGIVPLLMGWVNSRLANNPEYELMIAGPDEGEKAILKSFIKRTSCNNIILRDGIYNEEKISVLKESHFFALPSYSEGFPTSVLEAMQFGLIPMISQGCNFPEPLIKNIAINIEPNHKQIAAKLNLLLDCKVDTFNRLSKECRYFVIDKYSLDEIATKQFKFYNMILHSDSKI